MSLSNNDSIDTAFSCIQSGNELESQGKHWEAAVQFQLAHRVLDGLAGQETAAGQEEDPKVVDLYRQQAREYFFRSRNALLSAIQGENNHDQGSDTMVRSTLDPKDLDSRTNLFGHLYSRVPPPASHTSPETDATSAVASSEETLSEQTLQERLMQLNENLPSGFKTTEQRMADINRGLNRLGMSSIYTTTSNSAATKRDLEVTAKSESEQVDAIIQQARDEVQFATVNPEVPDATTPSLLAGGAIIYSTDSDDQDRVDTSESGADDDDDNIDESEEEIELTSEQILALREDMVLAQAEIAQLLVLLDLDDGGDAEIEFEQQAGLGHLRRARKALQHAAHEWKLKKK